MLRVREAEQNIQQSDRAREKKKKKKEFTDTKWAKTWEAMIVKR